MGATSYKVVLGLSLLAAMAAPAWGQCTITLNSNAFHAPAARTDSGFSWTASSNCSRPVNSNVSWITITYGQVGTGSGSASFTVDANTGTQRTGTITVGTGSGSATFTVTQDGGCTYSLSPAIQSATASGGAFSIGITSGSGCSWTASTSTSWITLGAGSGTGTLTYTVAANTTYYTRIGTIVISGSTFTVTQEAQPCTYSLSSTSQAASASGGSFSVGVTAGNGCSWSASTSTSWISGVSPASGSGNGTVSFSVPANTTYASRTGSITIAGTPFTVTQAGLACVYTITPSSQTVLVAGGSFSVSVTAGSTCQWSASDSDSWVGLSSSGGTGNGSVSISVAANSGTPRQSVAMIAGQNFLISQDGTQTGNCSYNVAATPSSFPGSGGAGQISVDTTSSCPWTAQSTVSWITLASTTASTGSGTVGFTVAANTDSHARTGTLIAGNQTVLISQDPAAGTGGCPVVLNPTSASVAAAASTGSFAVTASNCSWTAATNSGWISVTSGQTGSGNGTVGYSIASNPSTQSRNGTITVGSGTFPIYQAAASCNYTFSPTSINVPTGGGSFSFTVTTSCTWTATTTTSWIHMNPTVAGTVSFTADPNSNPTPRSGSILINDQTYPVTQDAVPCKYDVNPMTASFSAGGGGPNQIVVQTGATCMWSVQSKVLWVGSLTVNGNPGSTATGYGTIGYMVAPNTSPESRTTGLVVGDQIVSIAQAPAGPQVNSVVNGASFKAGALAPGELITIFGTGLGPNQPVGLQLTPDGGSATTSLGGTSVTINGIAAPLTYVSATQVNAIVPFEVSGMVSTQLAVSVLGVTSSATTVPIAPTSPAIFPGAVLNQDNSVNSAAGPAAVGSVLQIFATGFGQTSPGGVNGQICGANAAKPVQAVTATVGGVPATVQYAGTSNGLVAGVIQVNVLVPAGVKSGNSVPVVLSAGGAASPDTYTIAIH